ncbi:hypothetical protein QE250_06160 [Chromatiaceae bacterium AAb-1]|jgi:cell division inhibitor SulA|nr:hypothetical protein [Chromatiaceae bacterium AAb-1]
MHNQFQHHTINSASPLLLFTEQAGIFPATAAFGQRFTVEGQDSMQLAILRFIQRHQHQHGWTLFIAPPQLPDRFLADCYQLALEKVLIVHQKQLNDPLSVIKTAICSSTCSAVISFDLSLDPAQLDECQQLAQQQQTWFYQLAPRPEQTFSH